MATKQDAIPVKVIADANEVRSGIPGLLEASGKVIVEQQRMPIGDYRLSSDIVVERKDATDFILSIQDRRLLLSLSLVPISSR